MFLFVFTRLDGGKAGLLGAGPLAKLGKGLAGHVFFFEVSEVGSSLVHPCSFVNLLLFKNPWVRNLQWALLAQILISINH